MKYSLTKQVDKKSLVELFMMLSDSFDEDIPDIIWEGTEFEVKINHPKLKTDIGFISTKKGGEFSIKLSWITDAAKKQKAQAAEKKTKERLEKGAAKAKTSKAKAKAPAKPIEMVSDEELWLDEEESWTAPGDDGDWDSDDDDEW